MRVLACLASDGAQVDRKFVPLTNPSPCAPLRRRLPRPRPIPGQRRWVPWCVPSHWRGEAGREPMGIRPRVRLSDAWEHHSFPVPTSVCVCVYVCMVAVSTSSAIMHHESNREMLASGGVGVAEIKIGRRII